MNDGMTRRRFAIGAGAVLVAGTKARQARAAGLAWDALAGEFERLEGRTGGRLGVAVLDTGSDRRCGHRGGERFPLCSTFKVLACGAVLARVESGREELDRRIRFSAADVVSYSPVTKERVGGDGMTLAELCEAGLTRSDNTAANLILASLGGPSEVTDYARSLGDRVTRLDRTETALNEAAPGDPRDTTTPDAMAADLRALILGDALSRRSRDRLTTWMTANRTGDAKLRPGVPKDWRVGDKTGGGDNGTTNDIAVLRPPGHAPLIVCVYLTGATASPDDRDAVFAAIGHAVAPAPTT